MPPASWLRICPHRFPALGSVGIGAQVTFNCAAAWIASYSFGATTATKSLTRTTWAPGMWLIEVGSMLSGFEFSTVFAPAPRGRTTLA